MENIDHNKLRNKVHRKMVMNGYWKVSRESGTVLMLMITELAKLYDPNRNNRAEKIADLANRLYDYCGKNNIDLGHMKYININSDDYLREILINISNEMEAIRVDMNNGRGIINALYLCYSYALNLDINLKEEIDKKLKIINKIKKRKI